MKRKKKNNLFIYALNIFCTKICASMHSLPPINIKRATIDQLKETGEKAKLNILNIIMIEHVSPEHVTVFPEPLFPQLMCSSVHPFLIISASVSSRHNFHL